MYVVVWLFSYYLFVPDYMDKYAAHVLNAAKRDGVSGAALNEQITKMNGYKEMYKNPIYVVLFTYMEIFPVGLIVTIVSALILKRKVNKDLSVA
jgi:hypothetical protein